MIHVLSYSFGYDQELRPGQLVVTSNYSSYKDIATGDRFEVYVRYHRKLEGEMIVPSDQFLQGITNISAVCSISCHWSVARCCKGSAGTHG